MKNFRDSLNEHLKNPEFKKEWDALEEEYNLIRQKLDAEEEFLMRHSASDEEKMTVTFAFYAGRF